ncbi:hypothetical protein Tco_1198018 [Tanacetum coccineum]
MEQFTRSFCNVGIGDVIGLPTADGAGGTSVGVGSQGSSHTRWTKRRVQTERINPQKTTPTQPASQPLINSQVDRPNKKRKRSKHEDEPFVKDGKVSKKGRTITCQSCGNIGHNKATCKGQGRKATTVSQDGSSGSGIGDVIGLPTADGAGGTSVGVGSQGSSHTRWTKRRVQTERINPQKTTPTQPASQPSTNSQVLVTTTMNADRREMGDGIPT